MQTKFLFFDEQNIRLSRFLRRFKEADRLLVGGQKTRQPCFVIGRVSPGLRSRRSSRVRLRLIKRRRCRVALRLGCASPGAIDVSALRAFSGITIY